MGGVAFEILEEDHYFDGLIKRIEHFRYKPLFL
jgi:hypothetical protein